MSKATILSLPKFSKPKYNGYEKKIAEFLFRKCSTDFNVRLSDGALLRRTQNPKFTIVINDRKIFKKLIWSPTDYTVGKAFIDKNIDVEGDIFEIMILEKNLPAFKFSLKEKLVLATWVILFL